MKTEMALYDLTTLTTMCGGDPQFMRDFIKLFVDTTPASIEQIKTLRQTQNWVEIGEILHKIKPTVELFGMMHIHNEIKLAEQAGRYGKNLDQLENWLDFILPNLEESIQALSLEIPKYA